MSEFKSFTDLEVWKKMRSFKKEIEEEVKKFPAEERFRLIDQLIRAARSVNANIAEGHGRFGYPDQIKYCIQARGSLNECYNHLIDAFDCNYIMFEKLNYYKNVYEEVLLMLNGYIKFLRKLCNHKSS